MADPGLANGAQGGASPKNFSGEGALILNLKLSNSSHSERHLCSLATCCTSKNTAFGRQRGHGPSPTLPGSVTGSSVYRQRVPDSRCSDGDTTKLSTKLVAVSYTHLTLPTNREV